MWRSPHRSDQLASPPSSTELSDWPDRTPRRAVSHGAFSPRGHRPSACSRLRGIEPQSVCSVHCSFLTKRHGGARIVVASCRFGPRSWLHLLPGLSLRSISIADEPARQGPPKTNSSAILAGGDLSARRSAGSRPTPRPPADAHLDVVLEPHARASRDRWGAPPRRGRRGRRDGRASDPQFRGGVHGRGSRWLPSQPRPSLHRAADHRHLGAESGPHADGPSRAGRSRSLSNLI